VQIGIGLPMTVPSVAGDRLVEWGRRAERHGFSSLATTDHVVYPGLDPITPLAAAAAVTSHIELLSYVVVTPLRDPVLLAKQAAAVDVLSGGRLTLGVSVGWRPADFEATGRSLRGRGRRFDEGIDQMVELWAGHEPTGSAPVCPPLPRGRIPLLVGGTARLAARRVAARGDGWVGGLVPTDELPTEIGLITDAWRSAERKGDPRVAVCRNAALGAHALDAVRSTIDRYYDEMEPQIRDQFAHGVLSDATALRDDLEACRAVGVDTVVLLPFSDQLDELDLIASTVL
jgi:alkanesulfonate monooxygenase SsuD/methylene tetrahydromethanopterin reductase-like flavin-dependent oxidoreductase (luciferase family)